MKANRDKSNFFDQKRASGFAEALAEVLTDFPGVQRSADVFILKCIVKPWPLTPSPQIPWAQLQPSPNKF